MLENYRTTLIKNLKFFNEVKINIILRDEIVSNFCPL